MHDKFQQYKKLTVTISLYLALGLFVVLTNPQKLPIIFLIVPFILLFAALYMTVNLFVGKFLPGTEVGKRKFFAIAIASLPTLLLILSSINQLTWKDAGLMIILIVALLFYVGRINFLSK